MLRWGYRSWKGGVNKNSRNLNLTGSSVFHNVFQVPTARYTMQFREFFAVVLVVTALVFAAGCTGTQGSSSPSSGSPSTGTASIAAGSNLVPGPTDAVPDANQVTVDVGLKDYLGVVPVIFEGGNGLVHLKYGTARITRADGQVITQQFGNTKGSETDLQGTKQTDRVEVWVTMDNGKTYKVIDRLAPYSTRG